MSADFSYRSQQPHLSILFAEFFLSRVLPVFLLFLAFVMYLVLFCPPHAGAVTFKDWDSYLSACEKQVSSRWFATEVSAFQIPPHFVEHAKGVVSFYLDSEGKVSKVKMRHSTDESLRVAALRVYSTRGLGLLKAMDMAMVDSVEGCKLPSPPIKLNCPRRFVVIYDNQRFKPLRILLDDKIPIYQCSIPQALF